MSYTPTKEAPEIRRPLTAEQQKHFDELARDRKTAEATLNVALTFHANQLNRINKEERKLWEELAEIHDLDVYNIGYRVERSRSESCIVAFEPTERELDD